MKENSIGKIHYKVWVSSRKSLCGFHLIIQHELFNRNPLHEYIELKTETIKKKTINIIKHRAEPMQSKRSMLLT